MMTDDEKRLAKRAKHKAWRDANREHVRAYARVARRRYVASLSPEKRRAMNDKVAARARERNAKLKAAVYAAYGGYVCACCGETEPHFLSIDHINNDGYRHRKETGAGWTFFSWLAKNGFPPGFQVLCMNCNHGKMRNGGICPHVSKVQRLGYGRRDQAISKRPAPVCVGGVKI